MQENIKPLSAIEVFNLDEEWIILANHRNTKDLQDLALEKPTASSPEFLKKVADRIRKEELGEISEEFSTYEKKLIAAVMMATSLIINAELQIEQQRILNSFYQND